MTDFGPVICDGACTDRGAAEASRSVCVSQLHGACPGACKLTYVNACGNKGGQAWRQAEQICKSLQPVERI